MISSVFMDDLFLRLAIFKINLFNQMRTRFLEPDRSRTVYSRSFTFAICFLVCFPVGSAIAANPIQKQFGKPRFAIEAGIWEAIQKSDLQRVQRMLDQGVDPNAVHRVYGTTLLIWSVLYGDIQIVDSVSDSGADTNGRNQINGTALHAAVLMGHYEIMELLLSRGADPFAVNDLGDPPLHELCIEWDVVSVVADRMGINLSRDEFDWGRQKIRGILTNESILAASTNLELLAGKGINAQRTYASGYVLAILTTAVIGVLCIRVVFWRKA
jgi:Ankyrin repeats (3 copies)